MAKIYVASSWMNTLNYYNTVECFLLYLCSTLRKLHLFVVRGDTRNGAFRSFESFGRYAGL